MSRPYKVIVSLTSIEIDESLKSNLFCRVVAEDQEEKSAVPFQEVFCFDINKETKELGVYFYNEEKEIASGDLIVPDKVANNMEVETTERLRTTLYNLEGQAQELVADFNLTFINSEMFQQPKPASKSNKSSKLGSSNKNSGKKSTNKRSSKKKNVNGTSPLHSRLSPNPNPKATKNNRFTESELHNYMNKIVDQHMNEAQENVKEDLDQTGDCAYLNNFSKLANRNFVNSSLLGQTNLSVSQREVTDLDRTASPEKLKSRYSSGKGKRSGSRTSKAPRSPNKKKTRVDMTSILMDTETRRYVNEYKNQLEYLRTIIYALDLKLRDQETWKREVSELRKGKENGDSSREELRKTLLETTQELKSESEKFSRLIADVEGHNQDVLGQLKQANNNVDDLQTQLHQLEIRNSELEGEVARLRGKNKTDDVIRQQFAIASKTYLNVETRHAESFTGLADKIKDLDLTVERLTKDKDALCQENNRVNKLLQDRDAQIADEKANNRDLRNELDNLKAKYQINQAVVELLSGVQEQRDQVMRDLENVRNQNTQFRERIDKLVVEIQEGARDNTNEDKKRRDDLLKANQRIRELEEMLNEFRADNSKLKKDNIELRNHIITLEQLLCVKEDVYSQLEDNRSQLDTALNDIDKLREQVSTSSKVIEGQDEKIYELEKCLIYLKNVITEKDEVSI